MEQTTKTHDAIVVGAGLPGLSAGFDPATRNTSEISVNDLPSA